MAKEFQMLMSFRGAEETIVSTVLFGLGKGFTLYIPSISKHSLALKVKVNLQILKKLSHIT